ncbi:MAG TPA: hypothetical protein VKB93_01565 [Thermoanaerobaculia bacterium]|nr:hypothetical protein [Thermoanaerobaculia bacterium]
MSFVMFMSGAASLTAQPATAPDDVTPKVQERAAASSDRPPTLQPNAVQTGAAGHIYLDGSVWPAAGIFMTTDPYRPWIAMKLAEPTGGFVVKSLNDADLLQVRNDGMMRLAPKNSFFDGRTGFCRICQPYVPIHDNVVHEVKLVNPRDTNNGAAARVVFFNAETTDEFTSGPVTKFRAFTLGYYDTKHVNYDSVFKYHRGDQYHYRAQSAATETPFDTFWVKPASDADRLTGTRADMFVSGVVTVGESTRPPLERLLVYGDVKVNGKLTATTVIGAVYQDLAEWVPAAEDLEPGTVVVLNPARPNEVQASSAAYDSSVAGVVSHQPGIILGVSAPTKEQIATTGRVRVRVDAHSAPIAIGDLLVTSQRSGYAMKSVPVDVGGIRLHRPGTILGKALEPLDRGDGEILVLLSLQ